MTEAKIDEANTSLLCRHLSIRASFVIRRIVVLRRLLRHADRFEFAVVSSAGVRFSFAFVMRMRAAQERNAIEHVFLEPFEPEINHRRDEERNHLRENQTADNDQDQADAATRRPDPKPSASGTAPMNAASVVIMIGRKRSMLAS